MEVNFNGDRSDSMSYLNSETGSLLEITKQDSVEKLKARIAELELELQRQKKAAEKGDRLLNVMWGDDFNDESLH
ncbi:MAG: hypothetical protein ACR2KZ_16560 [Segetibacter sp.]